MLVAFAAFCNAGRNSGGPLAGQGSGQSHAQSQHAPARRGLTPPSSRAPTASHRASATVQSCIFCSAGPASRRRCRLMSNVRPRGKPELMHSLAPSPALMKVALRPHSWSRHAQAAVATKPNTGTQSQARVALFGEQQLSSTLGGGASRQQPMRKPRSGQPCSNAKRGEVLRAQRCFLPVFSWLPEAQGSGNLAARLAFFGPRSRSKSARSGAAWPNPSIKPSPNSKPPGQRYSAVLHFLQRWPGVSPLVPAYVER